MLLSRTFQRVKLYPVLLAVRMDRHDLVQSELNIVGEREREREA